MSKLKEKIMPKLAKGHEEENKCGIQMEKDRKNAKRNGKFKIKHDYKWRVFTL